MRLARALTVCVNSKKLELKVTKRHAHSSIKDYPRISSSNLKAKKDNNLKLIELQSVSTSSHSPNDSLQ